MVAMTFQRGGQGGGRGHGRGGGRGRGRDGIISGGGIRGRRRETLLPSTALCFFSHVQSTEHAHGSA
jgi:hypothetical protein